MFWHVLGSFCVFVLALLCFHSSIMFLTFLLVICESCTSQFSSSPVLSLTSSVEMILRVTSLPERSQKQRQEFVTLVTLGLCHIDPDVHFCVSLFLVRDVPSFNSFLIQIFFQYKSRPPIYH